MPPVSLRQSSLRPASLGRDRRSAVALLFAMLAIPIVGLIGLAIDFGLWNQTYASLSLAASGAALNAVKTAAAAELINDHNAGPEGVAAGQQWFISQVGSGANAAHLNLLQISASDLTVTVSTGVTTTATVTYNSTKTGGYVAPIFGHLFGATQYPLNVAASASIGTAPYLDVEILLDDSPSMEIGATPNDIAYMMSLTTCTTKGGAIPQGSSSNKSGQQYSEYYYDNYPQYQESTELSSPFGSGDNGIVGVENPVPPPGLIENPQKPYSCPSPPNAPTTAGPPCAFACHFDNSAPAGQGQDFFAAARGTINANQPPCYSTSLPQNCNITLRFDLVKSAVNQVISTMQTDDLQIQNLKVGIFSFSDQVTQTYPANCGNPGSEACQAGDDWDTAQQLVGSYPTGPNQPEPGIQPAYTAPNENTGYTDFPNVMTTLYQQYLTTQAGNGTNSAAPAKVLFLVTDGVGDYEQGAGSRIYPPFDPALCDYYKNTLGYQVYVVYTPYYSLMNHFYLVDSPIASLTYPLLTSTVATNLAACASDPSTDFVVADPNNPQSIANALQHFLTLALNQAARFTQ